MSISDRNLFLCRRLTDLLEANEIKIEGVHEAHAFLTSSTSTNTADISSTESSKENRGIVRSLRFHYACGTCSFPCRTKGSLMKHMQVHKNMCKLCNERFVSPDKLEIHMVMNHGEPKYSCQLCYFVTWNVPDMMEHFTTKHLDPLYNNCTVCNKVYQSKVSIQRHMYRHHCSLSIACTICRRIYKSFNALKAHTRLVHLKSGYQCGICKRRVATPASLEAHMRRHEAARHSANPDTYICTTCGETFFNKRDLRKHVAIHGGNNPYVCPVCRKAFEKRKIQVQHILTHMNSPLYTCDVCGIKYSRRAALMCHRKLHPGPLGPLPDISVIGIVSEFVKNYINKTKNLSNS